MNSEKVAENAEADSGNKTEKIELDIPLHISDEQTAVDETPLNIEVKHEPSDTENLQPRSPIVVNETDQSKSGETTKAEDFVLDAVKEIQNGNEMLEQNDEENAKNGEIAEPKAEFNPNLKIPDNFKNFKPGDHSLTLVKKLPDTLTKLKFNYTSRNVKDSITYKKIFIRGLQMGDLFNPTLYTLIQLAKSMEFDCKNGPSPLNSNPVPLAVNSNPLPLDDMKTGRLILHFADVLDRFTYLRRYLLQFEIPGRHIEISCTLPDDQSFDIVEMWKMSTTEEPPPCLSTVPDRQILARQLVLKNISDSLTEDDLLSSYKMLDKVEFAVDYQKSRCAILTFVDVFYCQMAHVRQYEVKFDEKIPETYLMTEMASKTQFLPLKLKEETEEEVQTRNTFNALWNSMLATVEEIRSKNKQNFNRSLQNSSGGSKFVSPLRRQASNANQTHNNNKPQQQTNFNQKQPQKSPQNAKNQQHFGNKQQQQPNFKRRNDSDAGGPNSKMSRKEMKRQNRNNNRMSMAQGKNSSRFGGFSSYAGGPSNVFNNNPWLNSIGVGCGGYAPGAGSMANNTSYPNSAAYVGDFGDRGVGGMPLGYPGEAGGMNVYSSQYGAATSASFQSGFGGERNPQTNQATSPQRNQAYGRSLPGRYFDYN